METITLALFSLWFELSHCFSHQHNVQLSMLSKDSRLQKTLSVPTSHVHVVFYFSVQVWTGPAPFLVRPLTTKAWPPLDLVPSLVGITDPLDSVCRYVSCLKLIILCIYIFCLYLVLPSQPQNLKAVEITQTSLRVSWQPGFGGDYPIIRCSVQVRRHVNGEYHDEPLQLFNLHVKQIRHPRSICGTITASPFREPNFREKRACFSSLNSSSTPPCFIHVLVAQVSLWESGLLD